MILNGNYRNLGDPECSFQKKKKKKKRKFADNQKMEECGDGILGVGSIHSRGVAEVMFCEFVSQGHSKGLTLICKGNGRHGLTTELEKLWKRNCALYQIWL